MTTRMALFSLLLGGTLAAGCKKMPPDCKKLTDTFCDKETGTPEECETAKKAAETKNANVCHSRWTDLFQVRKSEQEALSKSQAKNAMQDEIAVRKTYFDRMQAIQPEVDDLTAKLATAKGQEKKDIQAKIDDANKRIMAINAELQAHVNGPDGGSSK